MRCCNILSNFNLILCTCSSTTTWVLMDLENSSNDTVCGHQIQSKVPAEGFYVSHVEELHLIILYLFDLSVYLHNFTTKCQYYLVEVFLGHFSLFPCVGILVFPCLCSPTSRGESAWSFSSNPKNVLRFSYQTLDTCLVLQLLEENLHEVSHQTLKMSYG